MERMAYDAQEKDLTVRIPGITDVLGSVWAKLLTILGVVSLLIGITLEIQALITGYYGLRTSIYSMRKMAADMCDAETKVLTGTVAGYAPNASMINITSWTNDYNSDREKTAHKLYEKLAVECANLIDNN